MTISDISPIHVFAFVVAIGMIAKGYSPNASPLRILVELCASAIKKKLIGTCAAPQTPEEKEHSCGEAEPRSHWHSLCNLTAESKKGGQCETKEK